MRRYKKRRSRRNGKGGFALFTRKMWRGHRKTLMGMPFRQRGRWIAARWKRA